MMGASDCLLRLGGAKMKEICLKKIFFYYLSCQVFTISSHEPPAASSNRLQPKSSIAVKVDHLPT